MRMTNFWPWMAVAGFGALHGLNPATGWMFAAAWGVHARDRTQVRRALLPIAIGVCRGVAMHPRAERCRAAPGLDRSDGDHRRDVDGASLVPVDRQSVYRRIADDHPPHPVCPDLADLLSLTTRGIDHPFFCPGNISL